jgi:hypothetical protein
MLAIAALAACGGEKAEETVTTDPAANATVPAVDPTTAPPAAAGPVVDSASMGAAVPVDSVANGVSPSAAPATP